MFSSKAYIIYDPRQEDAKHFKSWWVIARIDKSIGEYYRHLIQKETGIKLNRPGWKEHISVIRGEEPLKNEWRWKKYQGHYFKISYSEEVEINHSYAWVGAESPDLENIRTELGLAPKPHFPFHITLGNLKNVKQQKEKMPPFRLFPWESPVHFAA